VNRSGAAYLLIDPELPRHRLCFQMRDAGVRLVLSRSAQAASPSMA
jgi:non-ribosomal peptide synthetase component F